MTRHWLGRWMLHIDPMAFAWFASLPNFITIGRLLLTPVAVDMILRQNWRAAFWVFVAAAVSDALDGWLARSFNLRSELGALLDALADKALIVSVYVSLAAMSALSSSLAILVVSRDVMIVGAVSIAWQMGRAMRVRPILVSKATTLAQLLLAAFVLGVRAFGLSLALPAAAPEAAVAALTVASASVYLWRWIRHMGT
jgi:cardiolipin synthase (CMP-forming)